MAVGILFVILALQYDWFASLDRAVYDLGLNARSATGPEADIVVIAIDKYSRDHIFPPPEFPISAHISEHGQAVGRLADAGAKLIAFDILFDQLSPELDVSPFVSAIDSADAVMLAAVIEKRSLSVKQTSATIREERLALPFESIPSSLYGVGIVNMPLDPDQTVRRAYYGREFQGRWLPSMPAAIAAASMGTDVPGRRSREPFYIDYSSPAEGFEVITYADLLEAESWRDLVRDRVALVGVIENSLSDIYTVPVAGLQGGSQSKMLPGVFILAYAAQTLISGNLITTMGFGPSLLLGSLAVLIGSFVASGSRLALSVGLILAILAGVFVCGIVIIATGLTILPTAKLLTAVLVASAAGMLLSYWATRLKSAEQEEELMEISSDLRTAHQIQQNLQPEEMPSVPGVEIAGFQIPCKAIGGDYYDVLALGEEKLALLIGDVSGKGISGALLMSNLQSSVRRLAPEHHSPAELVVKLNTIASDIFTEGRFVTFCYGILDLKSKKFSCCNAGHLPPLVRRTDGSIVELSRGGPPLGVIPSFAWEGSQIELRSGDTLFLYTDGLWEAAIEKTGEQFGKDRIVEFLKVNHGLAPEAFNQEIVRVTQGFTGSEHLEDDITLLTLKIL
ncbi:MAG: SpoIIE family protein phosphatase [Candidatus Eisenbacteria bacterium]